MDGVRAWEIIAVTVAEIRLAGGLTAGT
jgi:hypothetical protein